MWTPQRLGRFVLGSLLAVLAAPSCFDRGSRWQETPAPLPAGPICEIGAERCALGKLERCDNDTSGTAAWTTLEDCIQQGLVCAGTLLKCTHCIPDQGSCQGQQTATCDHQGETTTFGAICDPTQGIVCREGNCVNLCVLASTQRSNEGCEYWAVDLDNAMISASSNAAAQQFAVVVSNAQPDVAA